MKKRYCPKCYRKPIRYIEKWTDHTIDFDAVNGVPEEGISGNCEVFHK